MGLNCGYIVSAPGIAKAIAIAFGLVAAAVGTSAVAKAEYVQGTGNRFVPLPQKECEEFRTNWKPDIWCPKASVAISGVVFMWVVVIITAINLMIFLLVEFKSAVVYGGDYGGLAALGFISLVGSIKCLFFAIDAYKNVACVTGTSLGDDVCKENREKSFQPLAFAICGGIGIVTTIALWGAAGAAFKQVKS